MAHIKFDCPNCKEEGIMKFGESIVLGELRWSATQICSKCDFVTEMDDKGPLPPYLRDVVLRETGIWELRFRFPLSGEALKAIRKELDLSMDEVKDLLKTGSTHKAEGTHSEMQLIKNKLVEVIDDDKRIVLQEKANK